MAAGRRGGGRGFCCAAKRPADRAPPGFAGGRVPAGEARRRGRDGGGVPRPRRGARSAGGAEGASRRWPPTRVPGTVPPRGAGGRRGGPPAHHPGVTRPARRTALLYIAMRFVVGRDLHALIRREGRCRRGGRPRSSPRWRPRSTPRTRGLVHRDVKPANMLVDARPGRPEHVYLSDFGVARPAVDRRPDHRRAVPRHPRLRRPRATSGHVDGRTDQYALACVAYELLSGRSRSSGTTR